MMYLLEVVFASRAGDKATGSKNRFAASRRLLPKTRGLQGSFPHSARVIATSVARYAKNRSPNRIRGCYDAEDQRCELHDK